MKKTSREKNVFIVALSLMVLTDSGGSDLTERKKMSSSFTVSEPGSNDQFRRCVIGADRKVLTQDGRDRVVAGLPPLYFETHSHNDCHIKISGHVHSFQQQIACTR